MRTFKVIGEFEADGEIELCCPKCLTDALCPTHGNPGALIIAACGLALIMDPPGAIPDPAFMPDAIQCRKCKTIWEAY